MSRLDLQKVPSKTHQRANARWMKRGHLLSPAPIWGDASRGAATPGSTYPGEKGVTASTAPNAALLTGLGYVASPQTAWTTGQAITVNGYLFNWSGAAWAAGAHA